MTELIRGERIRPVAVQHASGRNGTKEGGASTPGHRSMLRNRTPWPGVLTFVVLFGLAPGAFAQGDGVLESLVGGGESGSSSSAGGAEDGGDGAPDALDMQSDAYVHRPFLNEGLPAMIPPVDLETPQASLANFVDSCEDRNYCRASHSLNLNDIPIDEQAAAGAELARMLHAVLEQKLWIDWPDVPDRPDGHRFGYNLEKAQGNETDRPRPFYHLGTIDFGRRDADIYLERVKVPDATPVWVVSRRSVSFVPGVYEAFGPSNLEKRLPEAVTKPKFWGIALWQWVGIVLFGLISLGIGLVIQRLISWLLHSRMLGRFSDWSRALATSVDGPVATIVGLATFKLLAAKLLRLAGPVMALVEPAVFVGIVLSATWLISRTIDFASARMTSRYEGEDRAGDTHAMLTRIKVAKHFFSVLVLLVGLGVAFWQFEWFQAIGYGLLASAGIAALVLGLAAQRPLGNLFAGVQLALTQPVRVGDAVIYSGEWGWIEEIAVTYVVIRTWDMRRLVVPTSQLMDNAVENWTKGGENMMKPVYLQADYRVDFAAVRGELDRILHDSDDWNEEVPPILQVTDCSQQTVELRALCSAKDAPSAWNLHCEVRERLVAFLQNLDGGAYLPRTRIAMVGDDRPERPAEAKDSKADSGRGARSKGRGRSGSGPNRSEGARRGKSRKKASSDASNAADRNKIGGSPRDGDGGGATEQGESSK